MEYKGRIYFASYNDKGNPSIYSVKKDGAQKKLVFADESKSLKKGDYVFYHHLVVCKGYIFARSNLDGLVRVKPDGTGYKSWDKDIRDVAAADGKIYYEDAEKGICSMNPDGTNIKKLVKKDMMLQAVDGTHIYYSDYYTSDEKTGGESLYRCDMKGKNRKKIFTDRYSIDIWGLSGEKIYYHNNYNGNIYRLDMKTGKKKKIYTLTGDSYSGFVHKGILYTSGIKVDIKTGKKTAMLSEIGVILGFHGDIMIYETEEGNQCKTVLATVKGKKIKTVHSCRSFDSYNWGDEA